MRVYKWMATVASVALMGAGCAEDGKDGAAGATGPAGATGAQGEKGDTGAQGAAGTQGAQGEKGDKGDKGDTGEAGEDGLCAGVSQLAIEGVLGNADPVFPGELAEIELDFNGGGDKVEVQFVSTATLLNGMATIPAAPEEGASPGLFDITPEFEGDYTFVAIATDGCTVATTTFTLKVRSALVSIVHVYGGVGDVGFAVRGTEQILFQQVDGLFGPQLVAAIGPGESFPGYFRIPQSSIDLDLFPAGTNGIPDLSATAVQLPTLNLRPNGRYIVAAYGDAEGELAVKVITPDQSIIDSPTDARVQFAHLAGGVGPVDLSATADMATPVFADVALGDVTPGTLLAVADYTLFLDANGDAAPDLEIGLPFETNQVLPGDYVVAFAWINAAGDVKVLVHDTGGDGTQYEGQIFPFNGTVTVYLPPPDASASIAAPLVLATDDFFGSATFAIDGPDGCLLGQVYLDYTQDPTSGTWNNEVEYTLTSPTGTVILLGPGTGANGNLESGRFDGSEDFAGEAIDGNWVVDIEDTYGGGVGVSELTLSIYCAE